MRALFFRSVSRFSILSLKRPSSAPFRRPMASKFHGASVFRAFWNHARCCVWHSTARSMRRAFLPRRPTIISIHLLSPIPPPRLLPAAISCGSCALSALLLAGSPIRSPCLRPFSPPRPKQLILAQSPVCPKGVCRTLSADASSVLLHHILERLSAEIPPTTQAPGKRKTRRPKRPFRGRGKPPVWRSGQLSVFSASHLSGKIFGDAYLANAPAALPPLLPSAFGPTPGKYRAPIQHENLLPFLLLLQLNSLLSKARQQDRKGILPLTHQQKSLRRRKCAHANCIRASVLQSNSKTKGHPSPKESQMALFYYFFDSLL